ncbi:6-phosphofructokinase [Telmatocola sphagniphila]|uniref:Pyrophosphate--fructose 6-phosphate 1-phosphotransferase n=1 Tax=Telmatocola sphagniphila TaxID=1123043 RepID=A0A8E6EYE5_9BACT|nr:diphosphate--fructose-6-phosphate 1-phosphotransferase [Telmatocola sphagniphila]QVL32291.1 6-phosphofructokinase [Telmatocola sphagniphila]
MSKGKLGIVVGGGPAPGINGVISSVTIEAINHGMEVIGFQNGFRHLVEGSDTHWRKLTTDDVAPYYTRGGSILGTARVNPAKKEEDMARVLKVFEKLGLTAFVTIGGDDTAYSGSQVAKRVGPGAPRAKPSDHFIRVCHVPKTIDNDLPLPEGTPTFGFETARHLGVLTTRALHADARTTGRWYIIVSMGRAAGHLALGIGKASASTISIIPEEFRDKPVTLESLSDIIIGSILKRKLVGKDYGVVVLAEGLIESIGDAGLLKALGEEALSHYGHLERDPHGHLRLGEIDFGRIVKDYLKKKLLELGQKVDFITKDLGYELRSADPIPFDAEYTRDLGYGAVKFLTSEAASQYGAVISFIDGRMVPLPFEQMIDPKTQRMKNRRVNVDSESYHCARRYMIRLEKSDFDDAAKLKQLADVVKMTPEAFRARFENSINEVPYA